MERHEFDPDQPHGAPSILAMRNALRGLFQGDLMPLRPRAMLILDDMEYYSDAVAQAVFAGTGVTVSHSTTKQEGSYALQMVIDATGNRFCLKSHNVVLAGFKQITLWERCTAASSAFQFFLRDNIGSESYWNLVSNGTVSTWQQDTLTLSTPDANNGAAADLGAIVAWGFRGMDASETYIVDEVKAVCGLNIAVDGGLIAAFYQQIYIGQTRVTYAGGPSTDITAPDTNPRIDLLVLRSDNVLEWIVGTEASSPTEPDFPIDKLPICLVYCRPGMVQVVDFINKDAYPTEGYIYKDVRPLFGWMAIS